jgi:hypothetical protein
MSFFALRTFADGMLKLNTGDLYFEFDSGHMGRRQLIEKIRTHYTGRGTFRVLFWMGTAEYAHWKDLARIKTLERKRLRMLSAIGREVLGHKPNRLLAAPYHRFLEEGKVYCLRERR